MRISFSEAKEKLLSGNVVAVPTETVYGLAACLHATPAIQQIFTLKGRPANNPLIIHLPDFSSINTYATSLPSSLEALSHAFWPGPLTLILSANLEKIPFPVRAGLPTVAFRVPSHPLALKLLKEVGPLVMPSANKSGSPSATHPDHIQTDFGIDFPILDGGACSHGVESTILFHENNHWKIVRQGALTKESLGSVLGYVPEISNGNSSKPLCPGQLYRHYAPKAKLYLDSTQCTTVVGFSDRTYPNAKRVFILGHSSDPEQVATHLYAVLRQLDLEAIEEASVDMNFPQSGLWSTISERLHKAAKS